MTSPEPLQVATPSDREIVLTRVFDGPRRMVFDLLTKPEHLRRWLVGPPGWTMTHCTVDLRVGGSFRYAWLGPAGEAMAMGGVYREIVRPERIVQTERFEFGCEAQAGEQLCTTILTEADGRTTMVATVVYPSKEARDGTIASGMEHGVTASYDRLNAILASEKDLG